jgi:transketolase
MAAINIPGLEQSALKVREDILKMTLNGGSYLSSALSCTDILVFLYKYYLNINRNNLNDQTRDYFFLSKGHTVSALYSVLAEAGIISRERLLNHLSDTDFLYWHPNVNIPGVEFHSGSLGHLMGVACGIAMDCKIRGYKNKITVMLGDGELNEGSVWETALMAGSKKLDNLIAIIDRNKFQANGETEDVIKLDSISEKFQSFRWSVRTADGHNFNSLHRAFSLIPFEEGKPSLVIANTVRGKGVPGIESKPGNWFASFTKEEVDSLIEKMHAVKTRKNIL